MTKNTFISSPSGNPTFENILWKIPLFTDLKTGDINTILQAGHTQTFERHSYFFYQGEPATSFYIILEGNACLTQLTPEGRQVIIQSFGPGDALAFVAVLANEIYPASAEASSDCLAIGWDRETTKRLMKQIPHLAVNSLEFVAGRFWELQCRYRELATERVEQRVARALLRLAHQRAGDNASLVPEPLLVTRQDLAEMTGTTLFSVSRLCSSWEQQGIVVTGREKITLLEPQELQTIAEDLA